jgi:hypothetical protein
MSEVSRGLFRGRHHSIPWARIRYRGGVAVASQKKYTGALLVSIMYYKVLQGGWIAMIETSAKRNPGALVPRFPAGFFSGTHLAVDSPHSLPRWCCGSVASKVTLA